jgi:tetratricopeptide (TPR) repeat protein
VKQLTLLAVASIAASHAVAQNDMAGAGDSAAATGGARPPQMNEGFIGRDIPAFDPGSEVASFDGKIWNINNNRLFRARFEKYLNSSPATGAADVAYRETIDRILELLAPGNANPKNVDKAFALLPKASEYRDDANLCRTMSDAIHAARNSLQTIGRLKRENEALKKQLKVAEWNAGMAAGSSSLSAPSGGSDAAVAAQKEMLEFERARKMSTADRTVSELRQTIENNKMRIALTELNTRGHLQALIMQYFATRRFEHVLIANRFYRAIYTDGDNSIDVYKQMVESLPVNKDAGQAKINAEFDPKVAASGGSAEAEVGTGIKAGTDGKDGGGPGAGAGVGARGGNGASFAASGMKLGFENFSVESLTGGAAVAAQTISKLVSSLSQIDSLANEAIRDVNEGVEAYKFLLEQGELNSATERLAETFALGEFMPSVRLLSREDKRKALKFTQMRNELLAALEVNDLTRAEKLVNDMTGMAADFDASKPLAKIETAKTISAMHLAKAKNAAISGDRTTMEAELRAATEIWPRNPALAEVGQNIFKQTDVQQQALNELDQLLEQQDHRSIYKQSAKFIAAAALYPDRQEKLGNILAQMTEIETALQRAREIQQRGDAAGAWESIQEAATKYPEDTELNRLRADLASGGAATFVRALNKGDEMKSRGDYGAALAWFLDAHRQYPPSKFAQERIDAVASLILPGSAPANP